MTNYQDHVLDSVTHRHTDNITTYHTAKRLKRKWDSITPTIRDNLHWLLV